MIGKIGRILAAYSLSIRKRHYPALIPVELEDDPLTLRAYVTEALVRQIPGLSVP